MTDVKNRLKIIDQLIERKPQYKEVLSAYREMITCIHADLRVVDPCVTRDSSGEVRHGQSPLFEAHELPIDFAAAGTVLSKLIHQRRQRQGRDAPGPAAAPDQATNYPAWTREIFEAILTRNHEALAAMGKDAGLEPAGLRFLGIAALRPWMAALRNRFAEKLDLENHDCRYCPFCGSNPDMASFDPSGKRRLHCELCGTQWGFQRIGCPFCGNQDPDTLGYLESEQEPEYRVYVCHKCQRYLKTVDKRDAADEISMDLEYLVTLHLDLLAAENHFK